VYVVDGLRGKGHGGVRMRRDPRKAVPSPVLRVAGISRVCRPWCSVMNFLDVSRPATLWYSCTTFFDSFPGTAFILFSKEVRFSLRLRSDGMPQALPRVGTRIDTAGGTARNLIRLTR